MQKKYLNIAVASALAAMSVGAHAADTYFDNITPLTASAGATATPATPLTLSSPNFTQVTIADRKTQNTLVPGSNSGNWDMITANETGADAGRYLFMPFETGSAGVQRVDLWNNNYNTRTVTIVAPGTQGFASGDASRWTPWGSYLTAEESWGTGSKGRLFEVTNATTAGANGGNFVQRSVIPRVSHEGLAFDKQKSMYFIDEQNGGSIYKYVSANPNATNGSDYFAAGQTFALKVGNGGQFEGTSGAAITGGATWVAITNATGGAIAGVSTVVADGTIDGRATADNANVLATGYNRPEDLENKTLANGHEAVFFTTTDSDTNGNTNDGRSRVYLLDTVSNDVKLFADSSTIDLATGLAVGGGLRNADNLAIDAAGNIYIIEDRDGAVDDDVWLAKDLNHDGDLLDAGEGLARWVSNGAPGSEITGLYFSKSNPNLAYLNIQHPADSVDRLVQISAVPEPESYAMFLAGLGLLGFAARRRAAK
ncbi:alkaline phosphatase PhoX [Azonexus sp. IMCC34842]|uniref:alkaline phosphatase PhoX n=1 Tax=Azonexus sp. IMCC34842 TaxID=3420950 RepID=UPI003D09DBDD